MEQTDTHFLIRRRRAVCLVLGVVLGLLVLFPKLSFAQGAGIQGVEPQQNSIVAQATDTIAVAFDSPVTVSAGTDTLRVFGSRFGRHEGTIEVLSDSIRFVSDCPFRPGETITVTVPGDLSGLGNPYVWQFTVRSDFGNGEFARSNSLSFNQKSQEEEVAKLGSVEIPSEPFAADFNRPVTASDSGDLRTDVAFVDQEKEQVRVHYGPGLDRSQAIPVDGATTLTGGDLDNDGLTDLVTVNSFTDGLTVLRNEGTTPQNPINTFAREGTISTGARPTDATLADINGDGALDLVVAPFGENEVYVYLNRDDGTAEFESAAQFAVGAAPTSVVARDLNRDGALELVVGSAGEEEITILENEGQGQGNFTQATSIDLGFVPASIAANDISGNDGVETGDGFVDFVVSAQGDGGGGKVFLIENNPVDPFGFRSPTPLTPTPGGPAFGTTLADVDPGLPAEEGIFDLDLISSYRSGDAVQTLLNDSNNGYGEATAYSTSEPVGVVDLDVERNQSQDFAVLNPRGTTLELYTNQGGRPGPVTLNPSSVDFSGVCVGEESVESVEVESISNFEVVLRESSIPEGFSVGEGLSLPVTLRPGETITVPIAFSPEDIREYDEQLVLEADEQTQFCGRDTAPVQLPIQVRGTGEGIEVSASPQTLEFGEVIEGNASTESFTLLNQGNIEADVQEIRGLDGTPFEVVTPPSAIPRSSEEQVDVRFAPTDPNASYQETVEVTLVSDCGNQETVEVTLTGSSRPPRPDLVAEEVFVDEGVPSPVRVSDTLGVQCRYSNQGGTRVENSFEWQIRKDGTPLGSGTDSGLAVGDSRETSTVEVQFPEEGPTEITCEVDSDDLISEQTEDNNTATLNLTVELPDQLPVQPNPFTPNNDGFNDVVEFEVREFGLSQPAVEIYTFEGRRVQTLTQVEGGALKWDGRDDGGERLPPGAYLYVVRDGGQDVASGDVVLAR